MELDRWQRIERLYDEVLTRPADEREAFLQSECGGDEELLRELESLLAEPAWSHDDSAAGAAPDDQSAPIPDVVVPVGHTYFPFDSSSQIASAEHRASLPTWAQAILFVAVIRTSSALILYLAASREFPARQLPYWVYVALAVTFTVVGLALVMANRRDLRAAWLGGVLVLLGAPLVGPLLIEPRWLFFVRPEAFSPAFFWRFIALFPRESEGRAARLLNLISIGVALVGVVLFGATLSSAWLRGPQFAAAILSIHWAVVMALSVLAFPVLGWRTWRADSDGRRRVRIFAQGLLLGVAPISLEVLLEGLSPGYFSFVHAPGVEPIVGAVIFGALAFVPFITAYSVLYDRIVEIRVVLRAAIQYGLARYTILAATLVPFGALALFLFTHRAEPMIEMATGPRPLTLTAFAALGVVAFRLRRRWLDGLDRRFFREAYDARQILARVVGALPGDDQANVVRRLRDEISQSMHADVEVFLVDDRRIALRHFEDRLPPLSLRATLAGLALADSRPMEVALTDGASPFARLPAQELHWLRHGDFHLIVPLRTAKGAPTGILALGAKRSGLPFSEDDRRLLSTVAAAATLAFDSLRLRSSSDSTFGQPARECVRCSRVSPPDAARCACGGHLVEAAVPYMFRGVFRAEQRIGAGGMGVVYKAFDLNLRRPVAMKTLPQVTPAGVARLRREARAMAALTHPNLAVIHGIEMWNDTPLLFQEYLAGGTLAERLAAAKPAVDETLMVVIILADTLQSLHDRGIIHCDIKPSNIGFTDHGIVKLLDFGLARALKDVSTGAPVALAGSASRVERTGAIVGTPRYMSPEAVRGEPVSAFMDLWSLSVVLYQCLTGAWPFDGPDLAAILSCILDARVPDIQAACPELPASFGRFFTQAFARDRAQRLPTAAAMGAALRQLHKDYS